ncbi:cytochrome c peroxidase [Fibrisoma limi BUZ 3]|uniref:Cytochrome c peroxidase n=1 Tax=Fibrisoma limi BUZ 3 TaxID=1185876 RepID=I2GIJ2_9BACT|nr:cytochrome c peroxidase [Fibrisoma limi]CCH53717.1 cytochrome c peroxidase [Fibrisoma limi BUZ 3]
MTTLKTFSLFASILVFGTTVYSCQSNGLEVNPDESIGALPQAVIDPADNPRTPEKVALGKALFYDPILSGDKDVSCATCHHPDFGYGDGLDLPIGVGGEGLGKSRRFRSPGAVPFTKRNTPTLLNVAFNGMNAHGQYNPATAPMFYDLRTQSLEAQSLLPIAAFEEMRGHVFTEANAIDSVLARLRAIATYRESFRTVFGGNNAITAQNLGKAIAAFERTLVANNAPFDRYRRGDASAMTEAQKRGMVLFIQNGCNTCHSGPMFSDYKAHVLGVADNEKLGFSDKGKDNTYAFRTPTLRNIALTAPYMHNGKQQSLADVLTFYDRVRDGEQLNANVSVSQLDSLLRPRVTLSNDLIEFMHALTDNSFDKSIPGQVPSGLPVGGRVQ